jgi:hypothetical protein
MYLSISLAVKSSVLLFMRRIFPTRKLAQLVCLLKVETPLTRNRKSAYIQRITMGLLIFLTLFTISGSFVAAFQCNPPKYSYDLTFLMAADRAEHCFPSDTSYNIFMYQAVLIFVCDIIIFILPMHAVYQLKMSRSKSVAILMIFGSGVVACIAPAIRFKSLQFYKSGSTDTTCKSRKITTTSTPILTNFA